MTHFDVAIKKKNTACFFLPPEQDNKIVDFVFHSFAKLLHKPCETSVVALTPEVRPMSEN